MCLQLLTMFTVPVLYSMWKEGQLKWDNWFGDKTKRLMKYQHKIIVLALHPVCIWAENERTASAKLIIGCRQRPTWN